MVNKIKTEILSFVFLQLKDYRKPSLLLKLSSVTIFIIIGVIHSFFGSINHSYLFFILSTVAAILFFTNLFCIWSTKFNKFVYYNEVPSISDSTDIYITVTSHEGTHHILPIHSKKSENTNVYWIIYRKLKYTFNPINSLFEIPEMFANSKIEYFVQYSPLSAEEIVKSSETYGKNIIDVSIPTFWELFIKACATPTFILQIIVAILYCSDGFYYYSIITIMLFFILNAGNVVQQINQTKLFRKYERPCHTIQVYRSGRWETLNTEEIVPGDLCCINSSTDEKTPCDMLLINGTCLVNESILTGESIPQLKEDISSIPKEAYFDFERHRKNHILHGGTLILSHKSSLTSEFTVKAPKNECLGIALRTGFYTSKGKLMRSLLSNIGEGLVQDKESYVYIALLFFSGMVSASYVWYKGIQTPNRNRYVLLSECLRIVASIVPADLPIQLSLSVNRSLLNLFKIGVFCSEPHRVPLGGKIDVTCFDKTGTLTSDTLEFEGVSGLNGTSTIIPIKDLPLETTFSLLACHSLFYNNDQLIGDPIESSVFKKFGGVLDNESVSCRKFYSLKIQIKKRFGFDSSLKRMSCICAVNSRLDSETSYYSVVKGAPEVLEEKFIDAPTDYTIIYNQLALEGYRILAIGYRQVERDFFNRTNITRDECESMLHFGGFLVAKCKIKSDALETITALKEMGLYTVMISGDNPYTACHVCDELKMSSKPMLILSKNTLPNQSNGWIWKPTKLATEKSIPYQQESIESLAADYNFCLTGESLRYLLSSSELTAVFNKIFLKITVFARVDPDEKELIIKIYKDKNLYTLMCGDGANDIGALQLSSVGVAIINESSHTPTSSSENTVPVKSSIQNSLPKKTPNPLSKIRPQIKHVTPKYPTSKMDPKRLMDKLEQEISAESQSVIPELGDASIAAPFTLKSPNVANITILIQHCICALVSTQQMLRIIAIESFITSYYLSIHYSLGIRHSESQQVFSAIIQVLLFFYGSSSLPATKFPKVKPLSNLFNPYMVLSVIFQSAVHLISMILIRNYACSYDSSSLSTEIEIDKVFHPNIINTMIFIVDMALCIITFIVNYHGDPFLIKISQYKSLRNILIALFTATFIILFNIFPEISRSLSLVPIPFNIQLFASGLIIANLVISYCGDRSFYFLFGTNPVHNSDI